MSSPTALAVLYAEEDPDDRLLAEIRHVFQGLCGYWFELSCLSREVTP